MRMLNPLQKLLCTVALGGLAGLGLGCVISVGPLDCSECGNNGCNSQEVGGECLCDPGYEWADADPNNYDCDRIPSKPGDANCGGEDNIHLVGETCVCDPGYNWCNPDDDADLSCCEDDMQAQDTGQNPTGDDSDTDGSGSGSDTDETIDDTGPPPGMCEEVPAEWNGVEPLAEDCNEMNEGAVFCSNTDADGPTGSRYWECAGGAWTEQPTVGDESCQFDGFDFAYGCVDDGASVTFVCGVGPGTDCSGPECNGCADDDVIQFCSDGKLGADSCFRICTEDGDAEGITYDFGSCVSDGDISECACCDEGEDGCPV